MSAFEEIKLGIFLGPFKSDNLNQTMGKKDVNHPDPKYFQSNTFLDK